MTRFDQTGISYVCECLHLEYAHADACAHCECRSYIQIGYVYCGPDCKPCVCTEPAAMRCATRFDKHVPFTAAERSAEQEARTELLATWGREDDGAIATGSTGGYLYVLALSHGPVKIGQTNAPGQRIKTHRANAVSLGVQITDVWVSERHLDYIENERKLLAQLGGRAGLRECVDVTFAQAVEGAAQLCAQSAACSEPPPLPKTAPARAVTRRAPLARELQHQRVRGIGETQRQILAIIDTLRLEPAQCVTPAWLSERLNRNRQQTHRALRALAKRGECELTLEPDLRAWRVGVTQFRQDQYGRSLLRPPFCGPSCAEQHPGFNRRHRA